MNASHIAVVDDEPDIVELVSLHLKNAGFIVHGFFDGTSLSQFLKRQRPDLIVLDLMLPDDDGIEIIKRLKKDDELSEIPIIVLSAKGEESDRVLGLELGADDYVTKPFSPKELVVRVKKVIARKVPGTESRRITIGDIVSLDMDKYEVVISGQKIDLTATEFKILRLLAGKPGMVFTRDRILDYLWGDEKTVIDRTVDMHVKNLRKKMGAAASLIKNVRGIGYKLDV
jgi:two-component system phosphate regulon response regulator PhoB/two-component system alkaline phosphatase synthesis response regulator PhoP